MIIFTILTFLFGSGLVTAIFTYFYKRIKANDLKTEATQRGVQALLRDRLYAEYEKYSDLGYAPIQARENFENMWTQYHNLGKNGVMDDIHEKFMRLPTEKKGDFNNE